MKTTARTLEYAYNDWCIYQLARIKATGKRNTLFAKRAIDYKNVFDTGLQAHARKN